MSTTLRAGQWFGQTQVRQQVCGNTLTQLAHTQPHKVPPHTHERAYVSLVLDGAYRERFAGRTIEYQPFTLAFHPPYFSHHDEIGAQRARFFAVEFDPTYMAMLSAEARPEIELQGGKAAWIAVELYGKFLHGMEPLGAEALITELFVEASRRKSQLERSAPHWLARVEERLRAEYVDPPTLIELAADAGVHPVHLSRTFRAFRRESIAHALWRLKAQHAVRKMRSGAATLADIALEAGFADQSHFTRIFKRITGLTPEACRRVIGAARHS